MLIIDLATYLSLRAGLALIRRLDLDDERGEIAEKVLLVFTFAGIAIAVGGIIWFKLEQKANDIPIDTTSITTLAP